MVYGRTHRSKKKKREHGVKGLLEAWVCALGDEAERERVRKESERLGRTVKRVRRVVWRYRQGIGESGKKRRGSGKRDAVRREDRDRTASHGNDSGYGSAGVDGRRQRELRLSLGGWRDVGECVDTLEVASRALFVRDHGAGEEPSSSSSPARHSRGGEKGDSRATVDHSLQASRHNQLSDTISVSSNTNSHFRLSALHTVDFIIGASETKGEDDQGNNEENLPSRRPLHRATAWYDSSIASGETPHHASRLTTPINSQENESYRSVESATELSRARLAMHNYHHSSRRVGDRKEEDKEEEYDPAQWTDISFPVTTAASLKGADDGEACKQDLLAVPSSVYIAAQTVVSSSSVYSTEGGGLPHPPMRPMEYRSREITVGEFDEVTRKPSTQSSTAETVPDLDDRFDPFATPRQECRRRTSLPSSSLSSGSSQRALETEKSSSRRVRSRTSRPASSSASSPSTLATSRRLSPVEFQHGLEQLSLECAGQGEEALVLPDHAVYFVGGGKTRTPPSVHIMGRSLTREGFCEHGEKGWGLGRSGVVMNAFAGVVGLAFV
ncbi:unnamed protein product [Discula destructiva]